MLKLGVLVGENGNWSFFEDIFEDLAKRYTTDVFKKRMYSTPLLYGRLNRWAFQRDIESLLRRNDVCFFEWASELLVPASHMPKTCAIVTRLHSYEIYAWAPKVDWDRVDKIVLVSEAMRRKFNCSYPRHAHKTTVIYNGRDLNRFGPSTRAFNLDIGMLCALNPRKRVYEAVMSIAGLRQRGFDAHLHIGGERIHGPDMDEYFVAIQQLVEKLGLTGRVSFYGRVTDPAVWLRDRVDIFVSNSYWEGNQVALIEAMATGCYCLSHYWDGAEEVLPHENLYLTEGEMEEKIIEYCQRPEEERRRRQGQMRAIASDKFDIERTKQQVRALIDGLGAK